MKIQQGEIERALITKLLSVAPAWSTKLPGIAFTPVASAPWQRGTVLMANPETVAFGFGAYHRVEGIYQIDLFYPVSERRTDILYAKADAVATAFYPANSRGLKLSAGTSDIFIDALPSRSGVIEDSPTHNKVIVEIHFSADDSPA